VLFEIAYTPVGSFVLLIGLTASLSGCTRSTTSVKKNSSTTTTAAGCSTSYGYVIIGKPGGLQAQQPARATATQCHPRPAWPNLGTERMARFHSCRCATWTPCYRGYSVRASW